MNGKTTALKELNDFDSFLELYGDPKTIVTSDDGQETKATRRVHIFLHDYQERVTHFKPNTAIAAFMEFTNDAIENNLSISAQEAEELIVSLSVFAPLQRANC